MVNQIVIEHSFQRAEREAWGVFLSHASKASRVMQTGFTRRQWDKNKKMANLEPYDSSDVQNVPSVFQSDTMRAMRYDHDPPDAILLSVDKPICMIIPDDRRRL